LQKPVANRTAKLGSRVAGHLSLPLSGLAEDGEFNRKYLLQNEAAITLLPLQTGANPWRRKNQVDGKSACRELIPR
jgi:hypothetical protein